jgi:ribose transport system permease protein
MSLVDHRARKYPTLRLLGALLLRYAVVVALVGVFGLFSVLAPSFLAPANLASILVNNFALLAIVSIGMTLVVAAGGIDLSVGTAIDFASLTFVTLVLGGEPVWLAALAALGACALVGLFNAVLIVGLGIAPFLATLGTLFIGRSAQQLITGGGNPIYLPSSAVPESFRAIGHGLIAGIPVPLILVTALAIVAAITLTRTRIGRIILAIGVQPGVARYSGLNVRGTTALVYLLAALVSAVAGIVLSATVNVYVPYSGNAFLLNAIGATFIGTTLSTESRPNILGTVLGVLLLGIVSNGLLLVGLSYYWQQVGTGVLIFIVLAASFATRGRSAGTAH